MKKSLMAFMAVFCCAVMAFSLTSCSDDDDTQSGPYSYSMGFSKVMGSNAMEEMSIIESAFIGALDLEKTGDFTAASDKEVVTACKNAEAALKNETFTGSYTFVIKNETTQKKVYTWSN